MKKILCLLVISVLIETIAFSEAIDLSMMPDDELLALQEQVNQTVSDRGLIKEFQITDGMYICGVDIKPGSYKARVTSKTSMPRIALYKDVDCLDDKKGYYYREEISPFTADGSASLAFSIAEGNVLVIEYSDGQIILEKTEIIG